MPKTFVRDETLPDQHLPILHLPSQHSSLPLLLLLLRFFHDTFANMSSLPLPNPEDMTAVKSSLYRETLPEISADNIEAAKHRILSSILSSSEGVCLRTPENVFLRLERLLVSLQEHGQVLRYVYDRDSCILKVMSTGNPIHQALQMSFSTMWAKYAVERLHPNKLLFLFCTGQQSMRMARSPVDQTAQRKIPARDKTPDLAIYFRTPSGKKLLTVAFEVGFSETYEDLLSDAKQWLVKKSNQVNIAIIINIKEDKAARHQVQKTPKSQKRLRELLIEFGSEEARLRDGIDSQPDVNSSDELFSEIESNINVDDWIGPLTASLEIWELNGQTPKKRDPTYVCLKSPLCLCLRALTITIDNSSNTASTYTPNYLHHGYDTEERTSKVYKSRYIMRP